MIGILAPYDRSETTLAAIRIANLAVHYGSEVRYIAVGRRDRHIKIHSFWDNKVWTSTDDSVYIASKGCQTLVHFQPSPSLRKMTEMVSPRAKHILIPQWHQLRPEDAALVPDHTAVVCPSKEHCRAIRDSIFQGVDPDNCQVTWTRFDAGLPPVRRQGTMQYRKLRMCVHANHSVIDFCGPLLIRILDELLDYIPNLTITLVANKSWPEQDRKAIRTLRRHGDRWAYKRISDLDTLNYEFMHHDWALIPWTRGNMGIVAMRALACGTPVLAYDIPPFNELINSRNGVLLPCNLKFGKFDAPTAIPDYGGMLDKLLETLQCSTLLTKLQKEDWGLEEAERAFNDFWSKRLELA